MKNLSLLLLLLLPSLAIAQTVNGIVTSENKPVSNATVWIKNSFLETQTDEEGKFSIGASTNETLVVSSFLKLTSEVPVTYGEAMKIDLAPNSEMLEAIVFGSDKEKEEEMTTTAFGLQSKKSIGYSSNTITKDMITANDIDLFTVLRKFPGVVVTGIGFDKRVTFRRATTITSQPPQVIVDGFPAASNILFTINPTFVEKITILQGLAANIKYGTLGVGGTILITTTNGLDISTPNKDLKTVKTSSKAAEKYYVERPLNIEIEKQATKPSYLAQLETATTFNQAQKIYKGFREDPGNSTVPFFLDSASYFLKWDQVYANKILYEVFLLANENPKVLKAIAYSLQQRDNLNATTFVYEHILNLRPDHIQSYRDLALMYVKTGEYELAATLYKQMLYNTIPNVDFTEIEDVIINEFRHLIANHKSEITYKHLPNAILANNFKKDVRLVLEWTDPLSEFEVQFVGPQKRYYNWVHTAFENREFIEKEITDGFTMKEFVIEDSNPGEWVVNIRNLGEERRTNPTFLKYTLYKNYGLANETKETKLIDLSKYENKVTLDTF